MESPPEHLKKLAHRFFLEARRSAPCVLYMPHLNKLWNASGESVRATFLSLLQDLPPLAPVLLLATCNVVLADLPSVLQYIFSEETGQIIEMKMPTAVERRAFFKNLLLGLALQPPRPAKSRKEKTLEVLPFAPSPPPRLLSDRELKKIREDEDNTMRELRIFLRDVHSKLLSDRRFKEFSKPVDLEEVPDYLDVIREPMDLSTMMERIDSHCYGTCAQYLTDVELITSNALKYNPDVDPLDKIIRHRACELKDLAHSLVYSQLEPEFEKACEEILASRARRGEQPCPVAPAYIFTNINNRKRITRTPAEPSTGAEQTHDNDEREPGAAVVNFVDDNKTAVSQHARNSPKNKSKSKTKRFGYRRRHKKGNWKRKLEGDLNRSKGDNSGNLNEMDDDTEEMSDKEDSKHEEVDDDFSNKMEDESVDKMNNFTDEKEELNLTLQLSVDQKAVGSAEEKKLVFPESSNNCINKNILTNGINSHDLTEYMEQGDPIIEKEEHVSVSESEVCNYDSGDIAVLSDIETPSKVNSTRKDEERECNKMYQNAHHEKTIHPNGICLPQAISRMHKVQEPVQKGTGSPLSIDIKDCSETLGSGVGDDTEKISELKNNCSAVRQERGKTNPGVDEDCRQQMENLLSRVVDVTIDLPVETLERYHCILHHCVHEHRRDTDKTSLIQKLEQLIESFVESKSEKR